MSNSTNKLKSGIKYGTEVILNLLSNVIGDSSNETNFPHKLSLIDRQVSRLRKTIANNAVANLKLSKKDTKLVQSGVFLDNFGSFSGDLNILITRECWSCF